MSCFTFPQVSVFQVIQHDRTCGRDGIASYIPELWAKKFTWDLGAGPIAKTVRLPGAICVRPASTTRYVKMPASTASRAIDSCMTRPEQVSSRNWGSGFEIPALSPKA